MNIALTAQGLQAKSQTDIQILQTDLRQLLQMFSFITASIHCNTCRLTESSIYLQTAESSELV